MLQIESTFVPTPEMEAHWQPWTRDGFIPPSYLQLNANRSKPAWFLALNDGQLCGVLTVFAPHAGEGEVQAWVLPEHRRKGIFKALWTEAQRIWDEPSYRWLWLGTDPTSTSVGERWGHLEFSEMTLERDWAVDSRWIREEVPSWCVEKLSPETVAGAAEILDLDFVQRVLGQTERQLFVLVEKDVVIGTLGVSGQKETWGLFAFSIREGYRRCGRGRWFLQTVALLAPPGITRLELEVNTDNPSAERLYRRLGFRDVARTDYYLVRRPS